MAQVVITINYREYAVSCENGEEVRIMKLARMLDEKAKMLTASLGHINESLLLAMVGLILADELSELKKNAASAPQVQPAQAVSAPQSATPSVEKSTVAHFDAELASTLRSFADIINKISSKLPN
jgi:cell division protein ZapA (FtsZ GTPase activity inhibitor)